MALPRPAPGTTRWWIIGVLGIGLVVAYIVWYAVSSTVGAVRPQVTAYDVTSDSSITVSYRLVKPADRAVTCVVTALDTTKGRVGTVTDEIPAGSAREERTVRIRTTQRAVTGVVDSCVRH